MSDVKFENSEEQAAGCSKEACKPLVNSQPRRRSTRHEHTMSIKQSSKQKVISETSISEGKKWNYRERKAICDALKKHGFGDTKLLASEVGTKSQAEVEFFIDKWTKKVQLEDNEVIASKLFCPAYRSERKNFEKYPPLVLWKKAVTSVMSSKMKRGDYSFMLSKLFQDYADDEPEQKNPNLPNLKAVYQFLSDCLKDSIPCILPPLESYVPLFLQADLFKFLQTRDLEEEFEFATNFLGPTKLSPVFKSDKNPGCASSTSITLHERESNTIPVLVVDDDEESEGEKGDESASVGLESSAIKAELNQMMENDTQVQNTIHIENQIKIIKEEPMDIDESQSKGSGLTVCKSEIIDSWDETDTSNTNMPVISERKFDSMSSNLKVKENLNPLMTHVYMLYKEKKIIHGYADTLRINK